MKVLSARSWRNTSRLVLGIRPDGQIVISEALLETDDGPTLEHGLKGFDGRRIHVPRREVLRPRPEYQEEQFGMFFERAACWLRNFLLADGRLNK